MGFYNYSVLLSSAQLCSAVALCCSALCSPLSIGGGLYGPSSITPCSLQPLALSLPAHVSPLTRPIAAIPVTQACSETAKGLANVVDTSQSTGLAALWAAVRRLLPIPGLR